MPPRTVTEPPTDRRMWRRLIARAHPDTGGADDLFVWAQNVYEHVCGDRIEDVRTNADRRRPPPHPTSGDRVDFTAAYEVADHFDGLTGRACRMASRFGQPYQAVLSMLADCKPASEADGSLYRAQHQGASYKQLAYIAHLCGMDHGQRVIWYEIAESIPLSQRHAGHLIAKLKKRAA